MNDAFSTSRTFLFTHHNSLALCTTPFYFEIHIMATVVSLSLFRLCSINVNINANPRLTHPWRVGLTLNLRFSNTSMTGTQMTVKGNGLWNIDFWKRSSPHAQSWWNDLHVWSRRKVLPLVLYWKSLSMQSPLQQTWMKSIIEVMREKGDEALKLKSIIW